MYNLKVSIDTRSGFCFGVVFAIEMAEDILREHGKLYCLGDIVHNDMEVDRLKKMGLEIISHQELENIHDAKVLIRAHGEPPATYLTAIENNLELIDASCPVVLKLQNRIRNSHENEENILIYGKKDHAEVIALKGQTEEKATVFMDVQELEMEKLPQEVTLYSQTTKSKQKFYDIAKDLRAAGKEVKVHDTICRQVSNREEELRDFARHHDKVVFVAGRKSSNGRMLYKICKEVNPGTHFVSNLEELEQAWFAPGETVGVCGATSTPQWLMEEVKASLEKF
ncbi:MAG: 4-hydroxy-3-methylbut-2-enyl diphosphate reductase [Bacteroidota bacterium]